MNKVIQQSCFEWREAPSAHFAVLGDPIHHSWSPKIHQAAYQALNLSYSYVAIRAPREEWHEAIEHLTSLDYKGLNITLPLKDLAYQWAQKIEHNSERYEALNTLDLQEQKGINTDVPAFLKTLTILNVYSPGPVLILGAGSTARALTIALIEKGFEVAIYNRTYEKAYNLSKQLHVTPLEKPELKDAQLILNTTPSTNQLPILWASFPKNALAYDLSYSKQPTPFLEKATQQGLQTVDGRFMLIEQAALAFEWWLGREAPREMMSNVLEQ